MHTVAVDVCVFDHRVDVGARHLRNGGQRVRAAADAARRVLVRASRRGIENLQRSYHVGQFRRRYSAVAILIDEVEGVPHHYTQREKHNRSIECLSVRKPAIPCVRLSAATGPVPPTG